MVARPDFVPPPPPHPSLLAPLLLQVALQLNEQGLNVALYWKNKDPRSFVNVVPTSAITGECAGCVFFWGGGPAVSTPSLCWGLAPAPVIGGVVAWRRGEQACAPSRPAPGARPPVHPASLLAPPRPPGIPDLLQILVKLTQSLMADRLMFVDNLEVRDRDCDCDWGGGHIVGVWQGSGRAGEGGWGLRGWFARPCPRASHPPTEPNARPHTHTHTLAVHGAGGEADRGPGHNH